MNQTDEKRPARVGVGTPPKQAGEAAPAREAWWWVERSIWTERMLTRLTMGESADRVWFSLMDKTYAEGNLRSAWEKVRSKAGSAGVDEQTVARFQRQEERELQKLREELREGTYRPRPGRRVWIDKPGSKEQRPLGIPAVRDRIVQGALRRVDTLLKAGHVWVVDADLKSYFDTIPHDRLMALIKERVADGRVLALVESFLRAGVMEELGGWQPTDRGTPQGGVISPLLANLYLNPLDHRMEATGWEMARYADDFVILCRSAEEAQEALEALKAWVSKAGLTLHPEKTRVVDANQPGGFDFLGYHFERGQRWPRKKSLKKLKEQVKAKTPRTDGRSLKAIVQDVNRTLRGWYAYFQHSKPTTFSGVDGYVRRRLRSLLEKRRGRTRHGLGRAHQRWPNAWFARRGLLSLAALHEWTRTIVALRNH